MKRGYFFTTVIDLIMRFLILHGITCLVISLVYGDKPAKYAIAASLIIVCAIFGVLRKLIKNFALFFILHMLLIVSPFFIMPQLGMKIIMSAAILIAVIDSMHIRLSQDSYKKGIHIAFAGVFVVLCIMAYAYNRNILQSMCFMEALGFITLGFIHSGIQNTNNFVEYNKDLADAPIKDIKVKNAIYSFAFAAVTCLFMLVFSISGLEGKVSSFIDSHARNMLSCTQTEVNKQPVINKEDIMQPSNEWKETRDKILGEDYDEKNKPVVNVDMPVVGKSIIVIMIVVGCIVVGGALVFCFILLIRLFNKNTIHNNDIKEKIKKKNIDKKSRLSFNLFKKTDDEGGSPERKIRKLYKKYIRANKPAGKDVPVSQTPLQISKTYGLIKKENDNEIRELYEKARYSKLPCGNDDAAQMKKLVKDS